MLLYWRTTIRPIEALIEVSVQILINICNFRCLRTSFLIPLWADCDSSTSFSLLKCLCTPNSTHWGLRTSGLFHLRQTCKELQVIEREESFFYTEKITYIKKKQDENVKE